MTAAHDRERGDWIPWYCEDSPGWLELSLAARGAAEGIARKMGPRRGELHLGSRGLRGLAVLLRCSWAELEPALAELTEGPHPRLVVSEDQRVILDPDHPSRRLGGSTIRMRRKRERESEDLQASQGVTERHKASPSVTPVTKRHLEERRGDQKRSDLPPAPSVPSPPPGEPTEPVTEVRTRRKPETPCPPSDATPEAVEAWAAGWKLSTADPEFARFLDHHRKSDQRWRDWAAAWRTWQRNAPRFAPRSQVPLRHVQSADCRAWKMPPEMP